MLNVIRSRRNDIAILKLELRRGTVGKKRSRVSDVTRPPFVGRHVRRDSDKNANVGGGGLCPRAVLLAARSGSLVPNRGVPSDFRFRNNIF